MADFLTQLFNLNGKVAALSGAGGYLVGEMARALARAGGKVALLDSKLESVEKVAAEIRASGGQALALEVDVRRKEDFERALAAILKEYGDLDYVVNGAGINAPTPFFDIPLDEWNNILAVQLTGTMLSCQVFGAHLVGQRSGSIINISSASA